MTYLWNYVSSCDSSEATYVGIGIRNSHRRMVSRSQSVVAGAK